MTARRRAACPSVFAPPTGNVEFDAWLRPRREAEIAKIFEAVGRSSKDKIGLATDLYYAAFARRSNLDAMDGSLAKKRLKKIRRILKAIEKQVAAIDADRLISATINKTETPFRIPPAQQLLSRLRRLEMSQAWLADQWVRKADVSPTLRRRRPTEREWLAGVTLPLVYERHFGSRAGRSRNSEGEPTGPMVRFIQASLRALGMPEYSPESIVRAYSRLSEHRDQHRGRRPSREAGKI
jgi:hypothetical protein